MMTKSTLPKLWLYIMIAAALSLLLCASCSKDEENNDLEDAVTSSDRVPTTPEYTVTYTPGSYTEGARHTVVRKENEAVILDYFDIKRDGFTLVGWQEEEGSEEYYPIGHTFSENRTVTLYPVWNINTYDIILSPGANGLGTPIKSLKIHATPFTLPKQVFTREGYTQIGWSIVDGGEQVFGLDGVYENDSSITLYPVWKINSYKVTVAPGKDSSGEELGTKILYGGKYTLPSAIYTRNDYELVGWATEDGGALKYGLSQEITVIADMTFYPVWELTKTYNITPDYKKLPKTLMTAMSVPDLALYYKLVNAYLNYESSVSFTTDTNPSLVLEMLQCYFPVMYADTYYDGPWIDHANSVINFDYVSSSKEEHDQFIADFSKALEKYLSNFNRTDTDVERALLLYSRLLENVIYDKDFDLYPYNFDMMMQSGYYAFMEGRGRSDTFSRAYAFLLTQADVDAVTVNSPVDALDTDHFWVALMLDFKWYYADVSLDLENKTFTHFGMSDSEMTALGYGNAVNDAISAYIGTGIKELIDTLDTRFHAFHSGAYSPVIDRELGKVSFKDQNGNENVFDIRTHSQH